MSSIAFLEKPHAVCIPYPLQGHINPMLKLAKLLHYNGFHITLVNTEFNQKRLLKSRGPESLNGLPDFQFKAIPDELPPSDVNAAQDIPTLCESITKHGLAPFKELLYKLNDTTNSNIVPPVSCIVSDFVMSFTHAAAEELGIPNVSLWTASACFLLGIIPLKDASYLTNGYLDTVLDWIPGLEGITLKDLPSWLRTTNLDDYMIEYTLLETKRSRKASAVIINTFQELDEAILDALSSYLPPIYTIGPLHFLENLVNDKSLKGLGSNLWKGEPECLEWLDSKDQNSVVYINFGSITTMTSEQLVEFACGLANSQQPFLWIIRPDLVLGDSAILPAEFLEETKERGLLASWCPQEKVLGHSSVGGFLTHSGWNSTLEILRVLVMGCL